MLSFTGQYTTEIMSVASLFWRDDYDKKEIFRISIN